MVCAYFSLVVRSSRKQGAILHSRSMSAAWRARMSSSCAFLFVALPRNRTRMYLINAVSSGRSSVFVIPSIRPAHAVSPDKALPCTVHRKATRLIAKAAPDVHKPLSDAQPRLTASSRALRSTSKENPCVNRPPRYIASLAVVPPIFCLCIHLTLKGEGPSKTLTSLLLLTGNPPSCNYRAMMARCVLTSFTASMADGAIAFEAMSSTNAVSPT